MHRLLASLFAIAVLTTPSILGQDKRASKPAASQATKADARKPVQPTPPKPADEAKASNERSTTRRPSPRRSIDRHELFRQRKESRDAALKRLAKGVLRMRKLSYESREGALEIPCYVFEELEREAGIAEANAERRPRRRVREKRPLLIWIHGGVHGDFDESYFPFVAEAVRRGYIVVAPEYRGSTGYGKDFYEAIDYGGYEVVDCLSARDFAARNLPNADIERTAMIGFSHGGFITMHGLVRAPDELVCGVAMVPVTNLLFRLSQKGPRYQRLFVRQKRIGGLPHERRRIYRERSPYYIVPKLTRPVCVHVATNDRDVTFAEAEMLIDALRVKKPKLAEVKVYDKPEGGHRFNRLVDPDDERSPKLTPALRDSWNRIWTFLEWHLRPYERAAKR